MITHHKVTVGPSTNFDELYTYQACPTRLYLKLLGTESEVKRGYTPPSSNPYQLGKAGEDSIKKSFQQERKLFTPEVKIKEMKYSKGQLEKKMKQLRDAVEQNVASRLLAIKKVKVQLKHLTLSPEGQRLKREHSIEAIVQALDYTTIPHHLVGKIDFVGIREDRSIVVIEVKNKERVTKKDRFQLEYYIHGTSKLYNYNKFYKHSNEILSQLYPDDYNKSLRLAKIMDLIVEELFNSKSLTMVFLDRLGNVDLRKLESTFQETDRSKLISKILMSIPSYIKLRKIRNEMKDKFVSLSNTLQGEVEFLRDITMKDFREGLLVDVKKSEIAEVSLSTDFDVLTNGVWNVKHNVYSREFRAEKIVSACNTCQFKKACKTLMKDEVSEEARSVTSIVHKGFYDSGLLRDEYSSGADKIENIQFPITGDYSEHERLHRIIEKRVKLKRILPEILKSKEWPFREEMLLKRGWKSLYADAIISKKIAKEFDYWKL